MLAEREKPRPGPTPRDASHDAIQPPKLRDLGITLSDSSRWQSIASIPEEDNYSLQLNFIQASADDLLSKSLYFPGHALSRSKRG